MGFDLDAWIASSQAACFVALVAAVIAWTARSRRSLRIASLAACASTLAGLAALVQLGLRQSDVPLRQPADVGLAAAVVLLAIVALAEWRAIPATVRPRCAFLGLAVVTAAIAAQLFAADHSPVLERPPSLRSAWLPVHAAAWSVALALTLAAASGRRAGATTRSRSSPSGPPEWLSRRRPSA